MPYAILPLLIVTVAALRLGHTDVARLTCLAAIGLLAAEQSRQGLLGRRLQVVVAYSPAWKVFAVGVAIIALEALVDWIAPSSNLSSIVRSTLGPCLFAIIIASGDMALQQARNTEKR